MNFFERQRRVKRLSWQLVFLFGLAVLAIVAVIDLAVVVAFGDLDQLDQLVGLIVVSSLLTMAVIGLASLFRSLSLRSGGGSKVAEALGARPVPLHPTDPQLRRLRNVVEEVAIASGTPVPALYVLENEPGINAFAAGWSPSDAAVAVTRGALERLNRDELQGVIAHEFSHISNGDMRLNIRLMGLLFGILLLALIGRGLLQSAGRSRNNRNAGPILLIGLALLIVGYIGVLIGRLIKAAVSRQREYLADASAVQFTRQTQGLTGALKKIGGLEEGSRLNNAKAEDVSHMLFGSGKGFSGLLATHPPLVRRIQALDPTFNPAELDRLSRRWAESPPSGLAEDQAMGLVGGRGTLPAPEQTVAAQAESVTAHIGAPTEDAVRQAGAILERIPEEFRREAHDPAAVLPLIFGLLLSPDPEVRTDQHTILVQRYGREVADAAWRRGETLTSLHPMLRLPLAEIAFPALRERPAAEQQLLTDTVRELTLVDGRLDVTEYCLSRLLHEELHEATHRRPSWGTRRYSLAASRTAAAALLAVLAQAGHQNERDAAAAFQAGTARLFGGQALPYTAPERGVLELERVWGPLDGLNSADKELLVGAMVDVISHDGQVTVAEMELLRTICGLLHCPLPPLAHQPAGAA